MMAWAAYVVGVGGALGLAGHLAERGLRHLGRPVRHVWTFVMTTTALVCVLSAWRSLGHADSPVAPLWLVVGWGTVSVVAVTSLKISGWTLRRNARGWRSRRVDGHGVLVTAGFGPGVIGWWRPRIVLPDWVLSADAGLRRLVLCHEAEHVRAGDTHLFHVLLALVALVPWGLPLWWQLQRARAAIESDCDGRVLAHTTRREYAEALLAVAGGQADRLAPALALAPGVRELEHRIRHVTSGPRERSARAGWQYLGAALAVGVGLAALPRPIDPPPLAEPVSADLPVRDLDREATILFSIPTNLPDRRTGSDQD
jgi:hypothetical protein